MTASTNKGGTTMSRVIAFLMAVLLAANGCGTSRAISSRIELRQLDNNHELKVYADGNETYELSHHALADSSIRGTGTMSRPGGPKTSFNGEIPLTSIHAIETGSSNLLKGMAVLGVTALFLAAATGGNNADQGLRANQWTTVHYPYSGGSGGGGESCPYVYSWNGERYVLEAEPFGIAVAKSLELTTVHLLPSARAHDGTVRLRLTNERPETHYVNALELYSIDLGAAPAAVLDVQGRAWPLSHPVAPVAATDRNGHDIRPDIASVDGRMWECDLSTVTPGSGYEDVLDLAFARQAGANEGSLVISGINTSLSTAAFGTMCRIAGKQAAELVHALDTDPAFIKSLNSYVDDASLKASVWNGRDWQDVGLFRPEATAITFTRALRIPVPESASDTVRIRLRSMADVWKLDRLAVDWTSVSELPKKRLELVQAKGPKGEDVRGLLRAPDRRYAILLPPDTVELTYAAGTGSRIVYAVAGTGYLHEWISQGNGGSALPVSWVPEAGRIDFLGEMLTHRDVTLSLVYEEWKRTRSKM